MSEQTADPASKLELKDNLDLYETFRSYIRHEDDLTNNRITWMLTIHGFLYASYGFTLQKKLEILDKINSFVIQKGMPFADYVINSKFWFGLLEVEFFLLMVAGVGMAISWHAHQSVVSARHALNSTRFLFELQFLPFSIDRKKGGKVTKKDVEAMPKKRKDRELIESVVNIGKSNEVILPTITGGGHQALQRGGVSASVMIPQVLFLSWIVAIGLSIWYFLLHREIIAKVFFSEISSISHSISVPQSFPSYLIQIDE
jgi:hypothetical protein